MAVKTAVNLIYTLIVVLVILSLYVAVILGPFCLVGKYYGNAPSFNETTKSCNEKNAQERNRDRFCTTEGFLFAIFLLPIIILTTGFLGIILGIILLSFLLFLLW